MFKNLEEVRQFAEKNGIFAVDLKFCNPAGRWLHLTIPMKKFDEDLLTNGESFDGSSTGFKTVESGDTNIIPDLSTGFVDPYWEKPTLSFICDVVETNSHNPSDKDPRYIAKKAEKYMNDLGIATESIWGPEYEFFVFDHVAYGHSSHYAFYEIDSIEGQWNSGIRGSIADQKTNIGNTILRHQGYHKIPPADKHFNLRNEMVSEIQKLGIDCRYHHHEVGAAGQMEIETDRYPLLKSGDAVMQIKYIIKNTAFKNKKAATFMPKPIMREAGNGMHFHLHLFKDGEPVFYDENSDYFKLSKEAVWFIGGILKHGKSLSAFLNPSTNSYRRLQPGYEAPTHLIYGMANRTAAVRIPKYATMPMSKRIEYRSGDATCNPYLAMSAILMAGLDGIKNKIDPKEFAGGPYDINIHKLPKEELDKIPSLPTSLDEALAELEKDHDYLTVNNVFPKEFIMGWIKLKSIESMEIKHRIHPYEMDLYFDV